MHRLSSAIILMFALTTAVQLADLTKKPSPGDADPYADRVNAWQNKARSILSTELKRDNPCDPDKSNAEFTSCVGLQFKLTEANYKAFSAALQASIAVPFPDDPSGRIYPVPAKAFRAAELAWRTFRDRSCEALQQTDEGGTAGPAAEISCKSDLTREHMRELGERFLPNDASNGDRVR